MSSPVPHLRPAKLHALGVRELSDPAQGAHAFQILIDRGVAGAVGALVVRGLVVRGEEIVSQSTTTTAWATVAGATEGKLLHPYVSHRGCSGATRPRLPARLAARRYQRAVVAGRRRRAAGLPGERRTVDAIDWQHSGNRISSNLLADDLLGHGGRGPGRDDPRPGAVDVPGLDARSRGSTKCRRAWRPGNRRAQGGLAAGRSGSWSPAHRGAPLGWAGSALQLGRRWAWAFTACRRWSRVFGIWMLRLADLRNRRTRPPTWGRYQPESVHAPGSP